eukprot:CAMPEP_0204171648 /NCGR_PEP_ID=MMETSP0361-20130328/43432_1 /ASSEMBLY_ACC=CAM_ASM_000343 /TAXON_ID=268821 /ORGANISM="Scrippsiella Hangoei, Strain SHTV-5" /LENGTH=290 /DNA_ID=CAMNT_0051129607 /DNA_START=403 /DNA_END=1274 /DNA_ORIENTATION=+
MNRAPRGLHQRPPMLDPAPGGLHEPSRVAGRNAPTGLRLRPALGSAAEAVEDAHEDVQRSFACLRQARVQVRAMLGQERQLLTLFVDCGLRLQQIPAPQVCQRPALAVEASTSARPSSSTLSTPGGMPCSIARAAGVPLSFPPEGALLSSTSAREASSAWTTSTAPARTAACSAPGSGAEALEPKAVGAEEGAVGAASASGAGGAATGSASASGAGGAAAGSASGMLGSAVTEEEFLLPVRRRAVPRPRGPGEAAWAAEGRRGGLPGSVGSDVDEAKAPDVWPMRGSSVL